RSSGPRSKERMAGHRPYQGGVEEATRCSRAAGHDLGSLPFGDLGNHRGPHAARDLLSAGAARSRRAQGAVEEATGGRRSRAAVWVRKASTPSAMDWAMRSRYSGFASFLLSSGWEMNPNSTSTAGASTPVST